MREIKSSLLVFAFLLMIVNSCKKDTQELMSANPTAPADNSVILNTQSALEDKVCGAVQFPNAAAKSRMEAMEKKVQAFIASNSSKGGLRTAASTVVTVPVVFHVVYNTPDQNISDAQLQSQITALNESYSATNTDIANVPAAFQPLVGNPGFQFALAQRDPNGNATTGIVRIASTVTSFSSDGSVCYTSLGGDDAWPDGQYLNIWVCNKSGAAGYSAYPWSGVPATDGILVGYNFVGTTGNFTDNWTYLLGRTIVHEVGHWFGLIHIWGDAVCGDDLVDDTPTQQAANGSCPTFPHMSTCSPNSNGDMYMDYMDYSDDACRVMFSAGQVSRMLGYLNTTRASLFTSMGAVPPGGGSTCTVPSSLSASSITSGGAMLNWGSTGATGYNVQYKTSASSTWTTVSASSNSFALPGLAASTTYNFQVQSVCSGGNSSYSTAASFTTLAPACNVPSGLSASSVSSTGATLSWASTGATSYNIQYQISGSSTWTSASTSSTSLSVSGLASSTAYNFEVQSVCSGSPSSYSSVGSFTTFAPPCNTPSGLASSSVTSSSVLLSWASTGASSYNIMYKPSSSLTWTNGASASSTSINISGLVSSTTYNFEVQSVCSGSTSAFSFTASFTTLAAPCNAPSGLSSSSVTSGGAVISWSSTGATSYYVQYQLSGSSTWTTTSTSSASISISGLASSTTYNFEVQSLCSGSTSAYSSTASFTTLAPPCNVPTGLKASSVSSNSATLSWASTGAVSYTVIYKLFSSSTWTSVSTSSASLTLSGLSPSSNYQFEVQSECSRGSSSSYSAGLSFTTSIKKGNSRQTQVAQ